MTAWLSSQSRKVKRDIARESSTGRKHRFAYLAVGVAHGLDTKVWTIAGRVDHGVAEWRRSLKLQPQPPTGPDEGGVSVPALEAIVESGRHLAHGRIVPVGRHGDLLGGQHLFVAQPHAA